MQSVTVAERKGKPAAPSTASTASRAEPNPPAGILPELSFVHPIPGFTGLRRFVLVRLDPPDLADGAAAEAVSPDDSAPVEADESLLYELRSLERPDVRFMVAAPAAYFSDYEIELDDQECGDLGLTDSADALVLVMLTVGRDAASTTANLLAPVVINARTRAAAQVILTGSDWPVRAPLG
jgi:flagellar assembly factor FliW